MQAASFYADRINISAERDERNAQQYEQKRGSFAFELGIFEKFRADGKGYDTAAAAHQRHHGYWRVIGAECVKVGVVGDDEQYSGEGDRPLPFELMFLTEAAA